MTTTTTWEQNAESGITLSNNDLTTVTATGTGGMSVRSTTSPTTGKAYIEFRMGQVAANGLSHIGVANSTWNYTQSEVLGRDANSFAYISVGSILVANAEVGSANSFAANDIVQLCVDFSYTQGEKLGRDAYSVAYDSSGAITVSGNNAGLADIFAAGDIVQLCVDFGSQRLIEPDHTISIWIDDQEMGHFDATQYCHDDGTPVALQLLIDLALSQGLAGPINTQDFGNAANTDLANLFRLSIKDVQVWGPPPQTP